MDIHVHIMMNHDLMAGRNFMPDFDALLGFMSHLDRPLDNMGLHMADAAVAGAVHGDGPGNCGRPAGLGALLHAAFGADQREGNQQRRQSNRQTDAGFPSENGLGKVRVHVHFTSFFRASFSAFISFTLILEAPAGGSNLKTKSGSFVVKSQFEKMAVYWGDSGSSL